MHIQEAHTSPLQNQFADRVIDQYSDLTDIELLGALIDDDGFGQIGAVSSFGADSALLLAMIAEIDASIPVIFLDTGKHFPETTD